MLHVSTQPSPTFNRPNLLQTLDTSRLVLLPQTPFKRVQAPPATTCPRGKASWPQAAYDQSRQGCILAYNKGGSRGLLKSTFHRLTKSQEVGYQSDWSVCAMLPVMYHLLQVHTEHGNFIDDVEYTPALVRAFASAPKHRTTRTPCDSTDVMTCPEVRTRWLRKKNWARQDALAAEPETVGLGLPRVSLGAG